MSTNALEEAFRLINQHQTRCDFEGAKSEQLVALAETALRLTLPLSYREFLLRLGCGDVVGNEFYGIIDDNFETSDIPNGIWLTLNERRVADLPKSLIIVAENGIGGWYCIDASTTNADGECPVVDWQPGGQRVRAVAEDFGQFLLQCLRQALN